MKVSHPRIAASMFAIFMMFINLGTVGGQVVGGQLTEAFGFSTMVLIFGLLNLVNLPVVWGLLRK
jgi:PAT family beta-lactamase induction signal transducer AmpG